VGLPRRRGRDAEGPLGSRHLGRGGATLAQALITGDGCRTRDVRTARAERGREETTPWNVELVCQIEEVEELTTEESALLTIGVPDKNSKHANWDEQNKTGCKYPKELEAEEKKLREETEAEQTTQEAEGKHGQALELKSCYAKRGVPGDTPAGCIRVDIVSPAEGLEEAFGGSVRRLFYDGFSAVGVPSDLEGPNYGPLQCEREGCTASGGPGGGHVKLIGTSMQLVWAR
jgi:hypothetical protein